MQRKRPYNFFPFSLLLFALALSACYPASMPGATSAPALLTSAVSTATIAVTSVPTSTPMGWQWSNALATFNDMAVLPGGEVWAIGQQGLIIHDRLGVAHLAQNYDFPGTYAFAGGGYLSSIDFIAQDDGWLTAWEGQIFHWDGEQWLNVMRIERDNRDYPVWLDIGFASRDDGWVVGCNNNHTMPIILHWDGDAWNDVVLPNDLENDYCFSGIDVVSSADVWAIGDGYQKGLVLHWNGSQWQQIPAHPDMKYGDAISAISPSDVWVLTEDNVFYWNGSIWERIDLPFYFWYSENDSASPDVLALSKDDVWVGGRALFHWNGSEWKNMDYDTQYGYIVDIESIDGRSVWALTLSGVILQLIER